LVLAVAMGVFAVGQGASWDRSQADQAAYRTGADIAVRESTVPPFGQGGVFDEVDGVAAVAPVARTSFTVGKARSVEVLATDTRTAPDLLHLREDLTDEPTAALLRPLGRARVAAGGLALPEEVHELRFRLRLSVVREGGDEAAGAGATSVFVTMRDRYGVPYRFVAGDLPSDGHAHTLTVRLADAAGGEAGRPAGPLHLTGFIATHTAPAVSVERRLVLEDLLTVGAGGAEHPVLPKEDQRWSSAVRATDPQGILGLGEREHPEVRTLRPSRAPDDPLLTARYTTGSAKPPGYRSRPVTVEVSLLATGESPKTDEPLPAVATDAFLSATGASVGDTVQNEIGGTELPVRITGSLEALPTTGADDGGGALLFDLAALDARLQAEDGDPLEADEWWLGASPGTSDEIAERLRAIPSTGTVVAREELTERLRSDPLGSRPRTALTGIAVAAAVLAATGFAVSAAGAARERRNEYAVLQALGAPRRMLARTPLLEQGALVLLSLLLGVGLGTLLTRLVVPLIVLTSQADTPIPALLVDVPVGPLLQLVGVLVAAPLIMIAVTALRGAVPAASLRAERGD
ncbi:hypothetical protein N566_17755, partial [Streptomycetaceae bacterium MP113-05]